jgi:hypothetical protein
MTCHTLHLEKLEIDFGLSKLQLAIVKIVFDTFFYMIKKHGAVRPPAEGG